MSTLRIRYYNVPAGRQSGYWIPSREMRAHGFRVQCCGKDGPSAWAIAEQWNAKWDAVRLGLEPGPSAPERRARRSREERELESAWPPGSVGEAFQRLLRTTEWERKAVTTRVKVWWPSWQRIRAEWGPLDPNQISFEMISRWRKHLENQSGINFAHKTLTVWRTLWTVMRAMRIAFGEDPSRGVRNSAPKPRYHRWTEGEVARLTKEAWRCQERGLACIIAVCWDTLFSPGDVRTLTLSHLVRMDGRLVFDKSVEGRSKTGRAAFGTISRRTERLLRCYADQLDGSRSETAILFRSGTGAPFRSDRLSQTFARIREKVFPGDKRQLRDIRRAGTVEIFAGAPEAGTVSAKLANSIERSNQLAKTYNPVDILQVRSADESRLRGRRRLRSNNTTEDRSKLLDGQ